MSMENATPTGKDVIYIDVDDEITAIIDKVRSTHARIVALVLPKRAAVFQSIVNMKLLKRTAEQSKKHLVLITSEAALLPMAGSVGLYVAKTLQSKPEIPDAPVRADQAAESAEEAVSMAETAPSATPVRAPVHAEPDLDARRPVGELAAAAQQSGDIDDSIQLDDDVLSPSPARGAAGTPKKSPKTPKGANGKKLKIPNFDKFRLWLVLGAGGLMLLIVLFIVCLKVLPKATVTIKTDRQAINASLTATLSPSATDLSTTTNTVPAQSQQVQKTYTQQVNTTGQQNNGQKASGTITMSAGQCGPTIPADVPAGTGVSANGVTFITQANTSFNPSVSHGKCTFLANNSTPVTAQNPGAQGNIGPASFSVAGRSDVSAQSSDPMTGGTDNIVKIVAQADIDNVKQKLGSQDTAAVKQELQNDLAGKGLYVITASFVAGTPTVTTSANAGDPAPTVSATEQVTYTMLGVKKTDLQKVIAASIKDQIDPSKQSILDYGLGKAAFTQQNQSSSGAQTMAVQTAVVVGTNIDLESIKKQIAGKKTGDVQHIIKNYPGVTDVRVAYSPFWVSSVPGNTNKITVSVQQPQAANGQ